MKTVKFEDGLAIMGDFMSLDVQARLDQYACGTIDLVHADPPYGNITSEAWDQVTTTDAGFADWMRAWSKLLAKRITDRGALFVWGGIGKPRFRPFYRYLVEIELDGDFLLANHITWKKKRAYGVQHNLLFCREELAWLHKGTDIKKPLVFNVPLLDKLRGYAGYSEKYPAHSEYLRRTNVWDDVSEIFRGKMHEAQKPVAIVEIPILMCSEPGTVVLDPMAGSFSTAIAARKNDRQFIVVEKDPTIFERGVARIRSGSLLDVVPGLELKEASP